MELNNWKRMANQEKIYKNSSIGIETWNVTTVNGTETEIVKQMDNFELQLLELSEIKK